jgi:FkbM family methyltransferase
MTIAQWGLAKYGALRTLTSTMVQLKNWREAWPPLRYHGAKTESHALIFRRGLILRYRPEDVALDQYVEVFRNKIYRQYIREPQRGVMVDIGANIGTVALDWATRLPHIRVHAYEPHPGTFAMLAENVAANQLLERVTCHQKAVGREAGMLTFHTAGISVLTTAYKDRTQNATGEFTASAVSLDEVIERCAQDGSVGMVKIDTEGAEADILEGAQPQTLKAVRQFVIEYHEHLGDHALARCERVLSHAGFRCITRPLALNLGLLYAVPATDNR